MRANPISKKQTNIQKNNNKILQQVPFPARMSLLVHCLFIYKIASIYVRKSHLKKANKYLEKMFNTKYCSKCRFQQRCHCLFIACSSIKQQVSMRANPISKKQTNIQKKCLTQNIVASAVSSKVVIACFIVQTSMERNACLNLANNARHGNSNSIENLAVEEICVEKRNFIREKKSKMSAVCAHRHLLFLVEMETSARIDKCYFACIDKCYFSL